MVYYSGHGSLTGEMQIERTDPIAPEELASFSKANGVVLVLVLDMCYASQFARRFGRHLAAIGWRGIVFSANDGVTSGDLAFEAEVMTRIRRFHWSIEINRPNWKTGRGLLTSAFALGLLMIKEAESSTRRPHTINLREFNDRILRPTCRMFAERFSVPLIRPTLHCFL